MYQKLNIIRY